MLMVNHLMRTFCGSVLGAAAVVAFVRGEESTVWTVSGGVVSAAAIVTLV